MWIHRTDLSQGSEVDMRWKQWHLFHCLFDEKKIPDIFWEGISLIPQKYFDLSSWHSFYWARVHCSHHSLPGWELFQTKWEGWAGRTGWGTRGRHSEQCVERGWEQQELGNVTCIFKVSWYLSWYWFQSREPISIRQLLWRGPGHLWRRVLSGKGWALESDRSEFRFWFYFLWFCELQQCTYPLLVPQLSYPRSKVNRLVIKDDRFSISINLRYLSKCSYSKVEGVLRHKLIKN